MAITALMMFALAVAIGGWRQMNTILQSKHPFDVAQFWMNPLVRIVSWILVALLSVASCYLFVQLSEPVLGKLISQFLFGVALFVRWLISMGLAVFWLSRHYKSEELFKRET